MELFQRKRLEICNSCEFNVSGDCAICGCDIQLKTSIAEEKCPALPSRWGSLTVMGEAEKAGQLPGCAACNKRR